jgi:hypothetical protein
MTTNKTSASSLLPVHENGMMMSFSSADDLGVFLDQHSHLSSTSMDILNQLDTLTDSSHHSHTRTDHQIPSNSSAQPESTLFPWNAPKAHVSSSSTHTPEVNIKSESLDNIFHPHPNDRSSPIVPPQVRSTIHNVPRPMPQHPMPALLPNSVIKPEHHVCISCCPSYNRSLSSFDMYAQVNMKEDMMPRNSSIENFWYLSTST